MPASHSQFTAQQTTGNMAVLPLNSNGKGPAMRCDGADVIDESLSYFKANIFFKEFNIGGDKDNTPATAAADRTLIYCTLYISECLRKMQRCATKNAALKEMHSLALSNAIPIPGEASFPLNGVFIKPRDRQDEDTMRGYTLQLRQEIGLRLTEKVYNTDDGKPSKRRFMDKSLIALGRNL